jgi:hypothetical protein
MHLPFIRFISFHPLLIQSLPIISFITFRFSNLPPTVYPFQPVPYLSHRTASAQKQLQDFLLFPSLPIYHSPPLSSTMPVSVRCSSTLGGSVQPGAAAAEARD